MGEENLRRFLPQHQIDLPKINNTSRLALPKLSINIEPKHPGTQQEKEEATSESRGHHS